MIHATEPQVPEPVEPGGDHRYARMVGLAELDLHAGSLRRVLGRVVAAVTALLPADCGASVVLWDPVAGRFTAGASSTADGEGADLTFRGERGASGWVVEHQEQLVVPDAAAGRFGLDPEVTGIGAYVSTPILADGRSVGVLHALSAEPHDWDADDLIFLRIVAVRAAAAVDTARLTVEARQERERSEALSFVANGLIGLSSLDEALQTIVDGVAAAVAADHVRLTTRDVVGRSEIMVHGPMPGHLPPPEVGEALGVLTAEVADDAYSSLFTANQVERMSGTRAGSIVMAPLQYRGRSIGLLSAVRDDEDFEDGDASLLSAMAAQAVVAIENARLSDETQEALAELSAVYEIVQAAQNSEASLEHMLGGIASAVAQALPAHRVTIAVAESDAREVSAIVSTGRSGAGERSVPLRLVADIVDRAVEATTPFTVDEDQFGGPRLVVPLRNRQGSVGILLAEQAPSGAVFTDRQRELATVMGSQVAVAVANALLFEQTERLASTDVLLGINNRRHLFTLGESALGAAKRYARSLSAVMFDIDHFKRINDTYGHAVGDEVLLMVAQRVTATIRDVDILGRYGGEEFGVVMPETGLTQALTAAERLRRAVGDKPMVASVGDLTVTISAGVAEVGPEVADIHELFERADAAMYRAKRMGRNQVLS